MDIKSLFQPQQGRKVKFRAITEAFDLIDSVAEKVDTQMIVHDSNIAIRDRPSVNLYKLWDHDSLPVWDMELIVETGLAAPPESRSRWALRESLQIWQGYNAGTIKVAKARLRFDPDTLKFVSVLTGALCLILCIVVAIAAGGDPPPPVAVETDVAPATTEEVAADHGFVTEESWTAEDIEAAVDAAVREATQGAAGADAGGTGGEGPQEPVAAGDPPVAAAP